MNQLKVGFHFHANCEFPFKSIYQFIKSNLQSIQIHKPTSNLTYTKNPK